MANMSFQERKKAMKDYTESLRKQSEEKKKKEKEKKSTTELNLPSREQYERAQKYAGMSFDEKRAAMKQESRENYARAQGQKMPNTAYSGARGVAVGTDTMLNNLQVPNTAYSGARGVAMGTDTMLRGLPKAGRAGVKGVIDNVNEMKMPTYGRPGARGVALGTDTMLRNMPNMGVNGARGVGAGVDALARGNRQQAEQPAATTQGEQQQYGPRANFQQMMEQYAKNTQKYAGQTKDSATSFSAWVNSLGGNYKPGELNVTPENVMAYLDEVEKDRQRGAYNQSSDSSLWSTFKKQREAGRLRTEGEAWQQWHDENAPKTAEEEKARNATIWENDTHPGQWLDTDGLDVGLDQKVNRRPDDYYEGNMREDYDQRMYDAMYGEGAYYDLLESDATVDEIELELDRMWDRLEKGEMHLYDEEDTAKNKAKQEALDLAPNAKNQKLSRAEELEEDARRERLLQQMAESAPAAEPFDESMNPGHYEDWGGEKDVFVAGGDKADNAFYNINNTWEDQQRQKGLVAPDGTVLGERPYWSEWKDEWFVSHTPMSNYGGRSEADIFNGYYRNGQKDEAMAFLQALKDSGVLAERKAKAAEIEQRERAHLQVGGIDMGWISGAGATLVKPIGDVMGSVDVIGSMLGVEGSGDPNSVWHKLSNMVTNVRDERGNVWDKVAVGWFGPEAAGWGKKFNGALYSILDNVVAMGAAKLGTAGIADPEKALKATTAAVQWIMSTGAAESTFNEKLHSGMKADEAAIYAIGNGIIEAITEKYSIEALLNADVKQMLGSGKGVWAFLGKNLLAEGSEEVASDVLSMALDDVMSAINGHESEFRARISELVNDYGLTMEEAKKQAMRETWQKFGESFMFGGLSGLIMSGGRVAINAADNFRAGRQVKSVNSILKNSGTRQLIEQGLQMGEGSQSAELANVMKQELDEGWNVSSRRLGQLAQNIQLESQEQAQASVKETIEKNAQELLEKGGENEDAVEELAPIVSKMITEGEQALTKDEKTALLDSPVAMQAVEDMTAGGELTQKINKEISKATEGVRNRVVVSRNLMEGRTAEGLNPKSVGEQLATENDIRRADGARVEGSGEVIYDGQFGKVTGLEQVTGEDGKTSWQVKVEQNGETKYADPAEVKATNFTTAAILRQRAVNPQFYGGNYTNTLLQQAQGSNVQNVGQYLQDAYKIRWAAYLGQQMPQTEISTKAAEELYLESRKDAAQEWQEAQQERQANFRGQGQGKVTFKGAEYGSEAFTEAVKDLDQQQRDRIDMVANIAQASGIELDFVDASDPEYRANVHGFENGKGITINLDSYDNRQAKEEGRKHHIIATMSHEMTHWLQRNNAQGYLQLQDFVLQKMADEGVNVAARAEDLMAQRGIGMTEAIDEIVANACDQVLGNQQLANELQQNNKGLYNSIKNFVRNIVNKIKSAVFGMEDSASLDAKRMMYKYGNELAKIWLGAYDDVLTGKVAEIEAQQQENEIRKMSQAELDSEYMDAVKSENTELMQQMVDEAARRAGYTEKAYHGTNRFGFTEFDMDMSQGQIFVAYTKNLASTYMDEGNDVRRIKEAQDKAADIEKAKKMNNEELAEYAKSVLKQWGAGDIVDIKPETIKGYMAEEMFGSAEEREVFSIITKPHPLTPWLGENMRTVGRDSLMMELRMNVGRNGMYELYTKPARQMIVNADGNKWNNIPFDIEGGRGFVNEDGIYDMNMDISEMNEKMEEWGLTLEDLNLTANTRQIANWGLQHGYDSVRINNVYDNGGRKYNKENGYGDIGIFFDEGNVKSADPVVYDDAGKVVPLSERFKSNKTDLRFSMSDVVEEREDGLIAVHNLNANNLIKSIKLGGFAMPSIAIVKADNAYNKYGDISVIFYPGTIDPQAISKNKVYGGDAWTPTYPHTEYKLNSKKLNKIMDKIRDLLPERMRSGANMVDFYDTNFSNTINSNGGAEGLAKRIGSLGTRYLRLAYLQDTGKEIKLPMKTADLVYNGKFGNDEVIHIADMLGRDVIEEANKGDITDYLRAHKELVEQIRQELNNYYESKLPDNYSPLARRLLKKGYYNENNYGFFQAEELLRAAGKYYSKGMSETIDTNELDKQLQEQIDEADYNSWVDNLFSGVIEKSGLRNNKSYYTNSGNPRSWEAMHDEETLDNVVRIMREQAAKGENAFFGQSAIMALGTRDFKSLDEIRTHKDQLRHLEVEDYDSLKENVIQGFQELMVQLADPRDNNQFTALNRVLDAIVDSVKTRKTVQGIQNVMKQWQYNVTTEQAQKILNLMENISNLPTEYFEAKPQRAVGLEEIAKVVLPANADPQLIAALEQNGVDYVTYDGTDEDRLAKINDVEGARFSIADDSNMEVASWMEHVSPWSLQTEGERQLVADYRGKRVALQLSIHRQGEYSKQIAALEAKGELDYAERQKLAELRNKLDVQEGKQARLLNELYQITGSEGYAGMMYRNQKLLDDYVQGKTIEQVEASVDQMVKQAEDADKEIAKRQQELKKMLENSAVQTIRKELNSRGLKRTAEALRSQYRTEMGQGELEGKLAEIVLMQANGQDISGAVNDIARDVAENISGTENEKAAEALQGLRGMTINIGPAELAQMKAMDITLADIRRSTKGSGVTFRTVESDKQSTMMQNTDEIRGMAQGIADQLTGSDTDISTLAGWISDQLNAKKTGAEEYGIDTDELALFIKTSAGMMLDNQLGGLSAEDLQAKIQKQAGKIGAALDTVSGAKAALDYVQQLGRKVTANTNALHGDIAAALDYYNTVAKQAAEVERNNVRKNVIEVLRNEHTKALIEQQQKYQDMMKNDRKAREIHQDNEVLRNKVNTELKRFRTLLTAETDKKNIQEEAKPLARYIATMLADHDRMGMRRVSHMSQKELDDFSYRLSKQTGTDGEFEADRDLDFLVVKAPNPEDNDYTMRDKAEQDLEDIRKGLQEYQLAERMGPDDKRTGAEILQERKKALLKVQEAVEELSEIIRARSTAFIAGQRREVFDLAQQMQKDMDRSRFKGERTGRRGIAKEKIGEFVGYGNLTPEYFIKMLRNDTMNLMLDGFHEAENNSGLQALAAKKRVEQIVKDTGADKWDGQEVHKVKVSGGRQVDMTTEQIMSLYATWLREQNALRPEDTAHLLHGGFVLGQKNRAEMKNGRVKIEQRPNRMTKELLDNLESYLTEEQKRYVDQIVAYMSGDLAEIGNRASLQTYGIRKFTEQYYFPIKSWGGVLNRSSTSGVQNKSDNAAMRQSFSKRVQANAQNAIEIGDFTATAMKHIVGMIRFNTVGPAVENLNKVLNQQLEYGTKQYGEDGEIIEDDTYKRNMRAVFQEKYGKGAADYLDRWMKDINGGVTAAKDDSIYGKLLSVFRKGAVAGSLSVAAQQPLSYIRAAMMVNPKYLAGAAAPWNWGKVHEEMTKYSGVAVIKDMGKFDMNQGRSMIDFISPEQKKGGLKAAAEKVTDWSTKAPEIMDQVTWGRMWVACKLETAAKNPGMDQKSDEFMQKVALRFNDLMRKTQVYDSVMVRSQHMRSQNVASKMMTSFMAEPTLTLNVLADAVQNADEPGGKARLAKAAVTFMMSAAAQAAVKSIMGAGRNPDEKKRLEEQFEIKFIQNFLSEINPMNLIPGAGEIVEALMKGEVSNDAMSVLGKLKTISDAVEKWRKGDISDYRGVEDTAGQVMQILKGVPAKNIMRDLRAMYNFFTPGTFASREHSSAVVKYGAIDAVLGGTNVAGLANQILQNNGLGYGTDANDYVERIYNAGKKGDKAAEQELTEYYLLGKSKADDPQKALNQALNRMLKDDRDLSAEEKIEALDDGGYGSMGTYIMEQFRDGKIDRKTAEKYYRQENPKSSDKDVLKALDRVEWEMSGKPLASGQKNYTNYTPLYVGIENNKAAEIQDAVDYMIDHGYEAKSIKSELGKAGGPIRELYMSTTDKDQRRRLRNALQIAYKRLGYTAEDADKTIEKWTKDE